MSAPAAVPNTDNARTAVDKLLGVFRYVPESNQLAHVVRFLSTWAGTDKFLMVTQYSSKMLVGILLFLHGMRKRFNMTTSKTASGADKLTRLAGVVGDARILFRIWSVLPMIQWLCSIERKAPQNKLLLNIERLQGLSMILYCPLEAVAYLAMHNILDISPATQGKIWGHCMKFWLLYVFLQFAHIFEDHRLLRKRAKALERSRGHPLPAPKSTAIDSAVPHTKEQQETRRIFGYTWATCRPLSIGLRLTA
ncbi:hypothetical protein MVES_000976 [Malassezia vespertilionis]|uniref:Uncharacterized protein n=1 Tax=Malassezia vespertilionis TaxID=2020962 RepID=A0A2N1JF60_9BASI|nr:hypothetical protein MVES_000976 [Malassezia vespertilionis]